VEKNKRKLIEHVPLCYGSIGKKITKFSMENKLYLFSVRLMSCVLRVK